VQPATATEFLYGEATVVLPSSCTAGVEPGYGYVDVSVDGVDAAAWTKVYFLDHKPGDVVRVPLYWNTSNVLLAPDTQTSHTATARVESVCSKPADEKYTFQSLKIDVVSFS
jgi:hypothetical protein